MTCWSTTTAGCWPRSPSRAGRRRRGPRSALGPCTYAYSAAPAGAELHGRALGHLPLHPLGGAGSPRTTPPGPGGAAGSTISQGAAQILSWGYLGIPRGGPTGFGPAGSQISDGIALGPFYSLDGSSAADGLNAAILSDGGMMYAAPSGVLIVLPRWALFNEASQATLGDATDGSQVPYLMGQAYDYRQHLSLQHRLGDQERRARPRRSPPRCSNAASQLAYFTRSALQQTISTSSDEDAYTLVELGRGRSTPSRRCGSARLSIDAASNPDGGVPRDAAADRLQRGDGGP